MIRTLPTRSFMRQMVPTTPAITTVAPPQRAQKWRPDNVFIGLHLRAVGVVEPLMIEPCAFDQPGSLVQKSYSSLWRQPGVCKPGASVELLSFFASVMNFTVSLVRVANREEVFKALSENRADMSANVEHLREHPTGSLRYSSVPIDAFRYRIGFKVPDQSEGIEFLLFTPFSDQMWMAMLTTALCLGILWFCLSVFREFFQIRTGHGISMKSLNIAYFTIGASSLLFTTFYPNLLTIVLSKTGQAFDPVEDINDLATKLYDRKLRLLLQRNDSDMYTSVACPLKIYGTVPVYQVLKQACIKNPPLIIPDELQLLHMVRSNPQYVTLFNRNLSPGVLENEAIRARQRGIKIKDSGLPHQFSVYYFANNSTLDIPLWLSEMLSARYRKLLETYAEETVTTKEKEQLETETRSNKPSPLSLHQMQGALLVWGAGACVAILLALAENGMDFWRTTQRKRQKLLGLGRKNVLRRKIGMAGNNANTAALFAKATIHFIAASAGAAPADGTASDDASRIDSMELEELPQVIERSGTI